MGNDLIIRLDDNKINIESDVQINNDKPKTKESIQIRNHPLINKIKERMNNNDSNNDMIDDNKIQTNINENNNKVEKIDTTYS